MNLIKPKTHRTTCNLNFNNSCFNQSELDIMYNEGISRSGSLVYVGVIRKYNIKKYSLKFSSSEFSL